MKKRLVIWLVAVAVIAGGGYFLAQKYVDQETDRRVAKFVAKLPEGTSIKYGAAGYSLWSGKVRLRDVEVVSKVAGDARIKGLTLANFDKKNRVPHYVKLSVRGFEMRREKALPETRRWMDRLGYKSIVVDVDYAYRYHPDKRLLVVERARISGPLVGTLEISGRFANIRSLDARSFADVVATVMQAVVRDGRVTYTDASLVDRLIRAYANDAGETEAAYRARIVGGLDGEMRRTKSANLRRQFHHMRAFVAQPGKVVINVKPRNPVPIFLVATVRNPAIMQRVLGITVTTTPATKKKKKKR